MTVLLLFFCSGATALVYEVIWSKYLALLFGSTVKAQTVVLAVFMGGLALGNRIFGRRADRSPRPLAIYGYLEVAIGLYAFFFSQIYDAADAFFAAAGSRLLDHSGWLLVLKGMLSAGLLLGPTILMGGTLPVLAAWLKKRTTDAGRRATRFYSVNSLGAVCGAGLAGFFLVTWIGLPVTLQMTALVNILIGLVAIGIAKSQAASHTAEPAAETREPKPASIPGAAGILRWGCVLVALTGAVSMGLEVLASRCLSLIFGASLQAFSIVLMAFILGIGLGSAVVASPRTREWPKAAATIGLVLGAASWIGLLVFNIEGLIEFYRQARQGLAPNAVGYRYYQVMAAVFSGLVLGLPAAALGAVLPLWIRAVSETSDLLGDRVGRLLTWNTLGAVVGVLLTGFVLMPTMGMRGSFTALALVLSSAALVVAVARKMRLAAVAASVIGGLLVVVSATGGNGWRLVFSSGVFRRREYTDASISIREYRKTAQLLFYEDAADATVSVEKTDRGVVALRVNGKVDASTYGDLSTQLLIAHLPLAAKPGSRDVFILGMGSGITAGAVLGHPIEQLIVAENCEPVLRAAKFFEPWNQGVLTNARTRVFLEDARTVLKLSPQKFDVIIAEPSNPWTVGVGSVFSREFYQIAANRLKPGGIMAQWFHVYEMNDGIVELVVRTFAEVFPVMEIWETCKGDIIMLGADRPWKSDVGAYRRLFALAGPRDDLASIGLTTPEMILARQLASQRIAFAIPGPGPIQSDDFPVLEYAAPRAFYIGGRSQSLCRFDERTWQADVASPEKCAGLATLDETSLKNIFGGKYESMNMDLQTHLDYLWTRPPDVKFEWIAGGATLPCIFDTARRGAVNPPPFAATNGVVRRLFEAEVSLRAAPEEQKQALAQIREVLEATKDRRKDYRGWSATYYASTAAKVSLRNGDVSQARQFLLQGLQLEPDSDVLQFLDRVLTREETARP